MQSHDTDSALEGVAIIGMAARLPGAVSVDRFWSNQLDGIGAIRRSSDDDLRAAGFTEAELAEPRLVRAFGVLDGVENFDARFFGYPPARAEGLDPQQRLLLEVAWHAMEHAGYAPGTVSGAVGTYLSITQSSYRAEGQPDAAASLFELTSRDKDYAASRVAYKLDLTGPAMMIQSASSGSLAAIHTAVEGVLSGQCDMAIAGGCSITLPQGAYRYAPGLMLSATGTCRTFDAAADGAVPGNGLGIVVLKPLADALRERDTIYAVIRGSALNNDGAQKTDYLAPSVQGQARVLGEALAAAGVAPETLGYIETHGTGTLIGDPIEIRALTQVFRNQGPRGPRCALGSLKPAIGHLHVASGVAGLIRAALAVHHGILPPSLNFSEANPELALADTPFYVNTTRAEWHSEGPRRAGVSAFGLGGTNVHVVLEQAPPPPPHFSAAAGPLALVLSAKTPAALDRMARALAYHLRATPDLDLVDVAWTLAVGRQAFEHRRAFVCRDQAEAIAVLEGGGTLSWGEGAMAEAARAWTNGAQVDWSALFANAAPCRVALPQYPFEAVPHWSQLAHHAPAPVAAAVPMTADASETLSWLQTLIGGILKQPPGDLDPDVNYEVFGIDSLLVNTITQSLQQRFPSLRSTALFEYTTLRRLADHLAASEPARPVAPPALVADDALAVIGLAGRYPGASDLGEFWHNLRAGRDSISEVPADRWDWSAHVDPDRKDCSYTRWGGFITDVDKFDPLFFGISPREARLIDPQQRLFLEITWAAIEHAGYTRQGLKASAQARGGDVGVFVGTMHNAYRLLGMEAVAAGHLVQSNHWSIPNRVSYLFDFSGPSLAVDTACSASLAALHLACESLRRGECAVAIAGGVNLVLHPQQPLELSRAGMLSKGRRNSTFGAAGDGFVQGEGVGALVLKPLSAALADGDRIEAVIRGSAMNAGGKTSGYTVPNPRAQAAVVEAALRQAGIDAEGIGYVECHGTGTSLGDPIEIAGLADAFRRAGRSAAPCAIGSVKSNIGHLEAAAGIAGLTKTILQLAHGELVPSLHAMPRNERIDFASGPFVVQEAAMPWPAPAGGLRRAGVSSFGAGGANVHVVLEEAPPPAASSPNAGPWLIVLSARDDERLSVLAKALRAHVAAATVDLADLAYTLAIGREAMEARAAFVVRDRDHLLQGLANLPAARPAASDPMALARAVATRDLPVLAELWMAGAGDVDWSAFYAGETRRRLALPSYPFLRERLWLPETAAPAVERRGLLGAVLPTLTAEARWRVPLEARATLLADHCVEAVPTLPGVASISLALEAWRALEHQVPVRISRLTWLRPVVASPQDAICTLREGEAGVSFTLSCDGVAHATAVIDASDTEAGPASVRLLAGRSEAGATLYAQLAARGLAYGPAFRVIESFTVSGNEASAVALAVDAFGDAALNPGLLDGALQLTATLIEGDGMILPFAVERIDVLRVPPERCWLHARRLDEDRDSGIVRFDVVIGDQDGRACILFHELAGRGRVAAQPPALEPAAAPTRPSRRIMARLFSSARAHDAAPEQVAIPPCYEPVWLEQPAAGSSHVRPPEIEVVGDAAHEFGAALGSARFVVGHEASADDIVFLCSETPESVDELFALIQRMARDGAGRSRNLTLLAKAPGGVLTPWIAGAMGLARVAGREQLAWTVRCLGVATATEIPAALADAGDALGREIVWRDGRRFVRGLVPVAAKSQRPAWRLGGTYLILGGAGGIGLELASHLAARHGARVALLGRTVPDAARQARIDAFGGDIAFFQANACDGDDMRRAVSGVRDRFGAIHGAIHSAIVMEDQAVAQMSAAAFHAAFDVKSLGAINLVAALAGAPLDFLAFFSSANSFAANAGQANYVAGCAFKDAYATEAAARLSCPVRVINWGFWGEVGRVADPVYRERLARRGVQSIGTAEGLAAIEHILGSDLTQVLVLKAEDRVLRELGVVQPAAAADPVALALAEHSALDAFTRRAVASWFARNPILPAEVVSRHRAVFAAMAELRARAEPMTEDEAAFTAAHPDLIPHITLLRRCIDHYGPVLRGEIPATDVMFPGSSVALVEGIYRGDRLTAHCNATVAEAVCAAARPGRPLRVLEVGAGTGGTSEAVLAALAGTGADLRYTYTDVSRAFLLHGERRFGARYPCVTFDVLDLSRDPLTQGFAAGGFDIVLGANCVHVTAELSATAARLRGLLAPGGSLVLYEMTVLADFATATFGLLDGWWAFADTRLPHGPLLDAPRWSRLLRSSGFADVSLRGIGGARPEEYRHTVIVATVSVTPPVQQPVVATQPVAVRANALVEALRGVVAASLQIAPEKLLPDRNLSDYGADSIMSVDLVAAVGTHFGIALKPTILFSHPTVERLAAYLAEHHGLRAAEPAPPPPPPPVPARETPGRENPARASAWPDDIAIIGMSGRFPGADTIAAFWRNIAAGVDSVGPVPRERWDHAAIYDPDPGMPGKTQCPAGGFLTEIDLFDPLFFNVSPAEATLMDPQQRLFLQEAWHALEDAGYGGPHPAQARCGVFVGTVTGDYAELLRRAGRLPDAQRFMGNSASMLAGRVAYRLDLHGPCLAVDTACSSSLVAVQLACESLLRGESDLALAGGVAVMTTSDFYLAASTAGMLSPSGRCRTLDAAADGFVPGEAVAAVVLKRREDAERDGDTILAVIKGAATNQDGSSNGITAPNGAAQTALERSVYERFGIDPASVGYVELHGTGTKLGDPIEIDALRAALGDGARCAIGSVKANIGHTLPAAGIAGLIKLVLALRHRTIPPAVHFRRPNEHLDLAEGTFLVPETARPWVAGQGRRRGAVSSFGFSGTNAHVVLEEAPIVPPLAESAGGWHLAVFSGQTDAGLIRVLERMAAWLAQDGDATPFGHVCATLALGRAPLPRRAAFLVRDAAALRRALQDHAAGLASEPGRDAPEELCADRLAYLNLRDVDWARLYPAGSFRRVSLPTYPFERRPCWPVARPAEPVSPPIGQGPLAVFEAVIRDLGAIQ